MDGPALCRKIRAQDRDTYTYVILLTAVDGRRVRGGDRGGADDFVTKPAARTSLAPAHGGAADPVTGTGAGTLAVSCRSARLQPDQDGRGSVASGGGIPDAEDGGAISHGVCPECFEKHLRPQLNAVQNGG